MTQFEATPFEHQLLEDYEYIQPTYIYIHMRIYIHTCIRIYIFMYVYLYI